MYICTYSCIYISTAQLYSSSFPKSTQHARTHIYRQYFLFNLTGQRSNVVLHLAACLAQLLINSLIDSGNYYIYSKMIPTDGLDFTTKQETTDAAIRTPPGNPKQSRTTSSWSRLKDPRIVCVSRAFGGKDRHSKVCTVRGIRDRRVRLSVPTAIQLYDLQDRLGLNQPSKVVDWLLNAAKHGIDVLPPLEIPDGCFSRMINSHCLQSGRENPKIGRDFPWNDQKNPKSSLEKISVDRDDTRQFDQMDWFLSRESACFQVPGLSRDQNACFQVPGLYNSFLRVDASNFTQSQIPESPGLTGQADQDLQYNLGRLQLPSVPSMPHCQVLVCQPGVTAQPCFPSQITSTDTLCHFGTQPAGTRAVAFGTTANLLGLEKNTAIERNGLFHA